jgi:hypothetical protein
VDIAVSWRRVVGDNRHSTAMLKADIRSSNELQARVPMLAPLST